MQNVSQFQNQFPLSKHKIYKKITGVVPGILFFSLIISVFCGLAIMQLSFKGVRVDTTTLVAVYIFSVSAIAALLLSIYGLYVRAYIKRYYYDSTDFITIKKGVFTPAEIHVQYQKIQDVYVDQDILDRLFGIYDVHIASATYASGIEAHIDGVDEHVAEGLKNFILNKIQGVSSVSSVSANVESPAVSATPAAINFGEEISSKTFPIDNKWYTQVVLSGLVGSMFYAALFIFWFLNKELRGYSIATGFIIWLLVSVVFFVAIVIRSVIWKSKFYFSFLPQFVMQKTGVIATQEKHLPYKSIQDVMIRQGLLEKILGLSTVIVQNASQSGMSSNRRGGRMNSADVVIPGQPLAKGQMLVEELNKVLARRTDSMGL